MFAAFLAVLLPDFLFTHSFFSPFSPHLMQPNAKIADPLCTFVFSIIVMMTTCGIMKDSIAIILEAVPHSISTEKLKDDLRSIDGAR